MSTKYGPVKWYKQATQAFHIDAGLNLPSGVTLTNVGTATATLESESASGARTDQTTKVTIGNMSIVTGRLSAVADAGIDYTLTASGTPPSAGDNYIVQIQIDRSDGTEEVLEQRVVISD